MISRPLRLAKLLSFAVPAALLAGAYGSQYLGGLAPCEMCYWQRWAHMAALAFALVALASGERLPDRGRSFVWLAGLAILTSGAIGAYHAGVEAGVFKGFTQCSSVAVGSGRDLLAEIMAAPMVRCDQVQWELLGISMAGWNAILSAGSALVILWLSLRPSPIRT
ncbi:MAG TPA: disulfide bond formation protein B [Allosphingosinicella sp.]|nr:disulfide bond formation protein B [Allosphingosinicella sp.]